MGKILSTEGVSSYKYKFNSWHQIINIKFSISLLCYTYTTMLLQIWYDQRCANRFTKYNVKSAFSIIWVFWKLIKELIRSIEFFISFQSCFFDHQSSLQVLNELFLSLISMNSLSLRSLVASIGFYLKLINGSLEPARTGYSSLLDTTMISLIIIIIAVIRERTCRSH